jgi:hypothetical protein
MPHNSSVIPYEVAFVGLLLLVAVLRGDKLARVSRFLIILYAPFALALSIYYLAGKRDTWRPFPNNVIVPDVTRYSYAMRRSSAIYLLMNMVLLVGAKVLGISYSNVTYNYISLFVTMMIAYLYDRCISTNDGLEHFRQNPGRTIVDSYLSFCSPSFIRFVIVMACEVALTIIISYFFGKLIPDECWLASTLFRKSIVPVVVYSIVGGPLRFAWAYPTVSEAGRVPYLVVYTITFTIFAMLTYASGKVEPSTAAGILILISVIAVILQLGSLSNAPHEPDVVDDANIMPRWLMGILSTIIVICTLVIAYRIFINYLKPYVLNTPAQPSKTQRQYVHVQQLSQH